MSNRGMGDNSGLRWISLSVDARFHPLIGCGRSVRPADETKDAWSRFEAWIDLICEASWKQREVVNKGKTILLERGELMAARGWLAARWNWTEKQVRCFIERLETEFMVRTEEKADQQEGQQDVLNLVRQKGQQKRNLTKVLSICNYDLYQTARELNALLKGQRKDQEEGQQKGQRGASEEQKKGQQMGHFSVQPVNEVTSEKSSAYREVNGIKGQPMGQRQGQQEPKKGPDSYQDIYTNTPGNARVRKVENPKHWGYNASFDAEERKAQHDVAWAEDGNLMVMNGFEAELLRDFPRVNLTAGLAAATGDQLPSKDRSTAKQVKAAIIRRFGFMEQDESGKDRRAAARQAAASPPTARASVASSREPWQIRRDEELANKLRNDEMIRNFDWGNGSARA